MRDRAPSHDGCGLWIDEHLYDARSDVESNYTDSPSTHEDGIAEYVFAGSRLNHVGDQP